MAETEQMKAFRRALDDRTRTAYAQAKSAGTTVDDRALEMTARARALLEITGKVPDRTDEKKE